jgi:hypothetical protein
MPSNTQGLDGRLDVGETRSEARATIQEAARIMGVSEGAIRKRVKRNTLRHDKDEAGRIYVYLAGTTPGATRGVDEGIDEGIDEEPHPDSSALISEMRARIESLERQLEQANERDRENRRIIAALTSRIPELEAPREAPQEPSESPETAESPGRQGRSQETPFTDEETVQEAAQPRSGTPWWRRMFGG